MSRRYYSTRDAEVSVNLLGAGARIEGVLFTNREAEDLMRYYGGDQSEELNAFVSSAVEGTKKIFEAAKRFNKESGYKIPAKEMDFEKFTQESKELKEAGMKREVFRGVTLDGARVMGFLSGYLEHGEDPVTLVARGLASLGYEISSDLYEPFCEDDDEG